MGIHSPEPFKLQVEGVSLIASTALAVAVETTWLHQGQLSNAKLCSTNLMNCIGHPSCTYIIQEIVMNLGRDHIHCA